MNDASTKDVSAWKPTEEELVSLGFKKYEAGFEFVNERTDDDSYVRIWFYKKKKQFGLWLKEDYFSGEIMGDIYPKSLEELKTLISMMNP